MFNKAVHDTKDFEFFPCSSEVVIMERSEGSHASPKIRVLIPRHPERSKTYTKWRSCAAEGPRAPLRNHELSKAFFRCRPSPSRTPANRTVVILSETKDLMLPALPHINKLE